MLSETMRRPTDIFSAMLLGILAFLFGFGIVTVISGGLPDIIGILAGLSGAARALVH
jgi:hypothetical protein